MFHPLAHLLWTSIPMHWFLHFCHFDEVQFICWAHLRIACGARLQVKQWRLIIRNLPFSVDEPELIKFVGEAAMVWGASIPKHSSGKKKGFGFVSFTCRAHALKAMEHVNAKVCCNTAIE